ncbi:nucleotide-sugar uncharacterized transporter 2 isoform X1 [Ricinus communis]|uniref:Organic anion transporter, putative n=1 Tax=Ricinus communis TaxID=3988 RepID=B9S9X6_RICCO|nr:nucleotide-sugar uncharacterized transporter 2 isoform X1 [Ricinus communis]EEF39646.1 organic anion transporter, putative [Ricinus communis]|eukprot:XP_002522795.1 nucleotide-sugar uncharacterized transporter 2 isoform X1 [Ricinus communis]
MGLLESLLGNDARKFLKRKDSDAGEAGRALEDLRSSVYSDLRTSEGAKRQQQRFCGPIVAMTFNFMVAVGVILTNKLVMGQIGFNFPIFLTFIHYTTAWILLAIFKGLSLLPISPPSKTTPFTSLFSLGVVMSFASGLANASLNHNSVGFYQMAKIAVTPTIVLAEFVLFRKTISHKKILSLVLVSAGVAVATVTDLQFNLFGACIAIAWIIPSAINKILWSNLQQQANWTALALMWKTTPVTILFLVALMPWLDPPGVLFFKWNLHNSSAVFISALLGFLLQWSGALALGATSATSHVVLGQFKTCVILLGGHLFFNSDPGFVSIGGAVAALGGMSAYTSLNLQESREKVLNSQLLKQTLPLSKPKMEPKPATEDSTETNGTNTANVV